MQTLNQVTALFTQRSLNAIQGLLSQSAERLSSGLRINRAKEDSAGLGISQELQRQTRAFAIASRNINDAMSMAQTAEGSLQNVSQMLLRLKELSTQGANQSLSKDQRTAIADEIGQIRNEINAITERTTFNGLKLLRGDFSQAVKDEFSKASELDGTNNSVFASSTIKLGVESPASADNTKSRFSIADIQADQALDGHYTLSNNGAVITLSATINGEKKSEQLTIVSGATTGANQVSISDATMVLDFSKLGITLTIENERVGTGDRSASEVATKIAALGVTPNLEYKDAGWKTVEGADWASASSYGLGSTDILKAIISSSGGNIRLGSTTNLLAVKGYNGATADTDGTRTTWTDGTTTEIAFRGTEAQLNAALATLQVNSTTGEDQITVDVVPASISVYTSSEGVTSYYRVVNTATTWSTAKTNAESVGLQFNGLTGYLVNVTSAEENYFLTQKLSVDMWMGASDDYSYINAAINQKNGTSGVITYADQVASEGKWYWIDGPEAGTQILTSNSNTAKVSGAYSNFKSGEPNNSSSIEHYAQFYASSTTTATVNGQSVQVSAWNDLPNTSTLGSIVEYGGVKGVTANTSKTILIGTPGYINVGDAVEITSIQTTGVGTGNADTGIYRMSADTVAETVTLKRFDVDGETLLGSQTLSVPDGLGSGRNTKLKFENLGVAVTLSNAADRSITLGDLESGLEKDLTIASSRMATSVSDGGPTFQIGSASKNEFSIGSFKDMRLGKNADGQHGELFNQVDSLISGLDAASDPSIADFQELQNRVEDVIEVVSSQRSDFGAIQNRLESAIRNIGEQFVNLNAARSQIQDVDYASETARLTKMQIGQQAATAMMAQANQIPNVILALIA
jgi:flagellin-like hook-associated protein FlgL